VKLFAAARELAGRGEIELDLPVGATVGTLRKELCAASPQLTPLAERSMIAVNEEYRVDSTQVNDGDVAALIPPVSGG
jgi:molybdopterin synthase catalytic subunit/molybdopterin synthase sulfur carrier subunit